MSVVVAVGLGFWFRIASDGTVLACVLGSLVGVRCRLGLGLRGLWTLLFDLVRCDWFCILGYGWAVFFWGVLEGLRPGVVRSGGRLRMGRLVPRALGSGCSKMRVVGQWFGCYWGYGG